jgi:alkanesulfonate monooxygenase SsuD/methylene tetrahydromethanopterin reductase-like flavin-dependent oxidoreductase (luciferase family)
MEFGLVLSNQHPEGSDMTRHFREHVDQTRLAAECGFDAIFCGEHFLMPPYQMLHSMTFLARIAADSGNMKVGTGILLLALRNPVETADMVATLDVITGGRVIFGVGLGYRREEFEAFGIPRIMAHRVFEERLILIKRLWTTEGEFDYNGFAVRLSGARCTLRPVQKPHPPIWVAANNYRGVIRAARLGDAWYMNPHARLDTLIDQMTLYKRALLQEGKQEPTVIPLMREVYIDETYERARRVAQPFLEQKYRIYVRWGQDRALPKSDRLNQPFDFLARDRFVIGGPDEVIRELERYISALGVNFFTVRLQWPGMEHELAVRAIRLFGRYVIPYFKSKYPGASEVS